MPKDICIPIYFADIAKFPSIRFEPFHTPTGNYESMFCQSVLSTFGFCQFVILKKHPVWILIYLSTTRSELNLFIEQIFIESLLSASLILEDENIKVNQTEKK